MREPMTFTCSSPAWTSPARKCFCLITKRPFLGLIKHKKKPSEVQGYFSLRGSDALTCKYSRTIGCVLLVSSYRIVVLILTVEVIFAEFYLISGISVSICKRDAFSDNRSHVSHLLHDARPSPKSTATNPNTSRFSFHKFRCVCLIQM